MPEREMSSQAGNTRRFQIDADAGETAIEIVLPERLPKGRGLNEYKVVKKDIPGEARGKTFRGKEVRWINNYGIRLRGNFGVKQGGAKQDPFVDEVDGEQFDYEIVVPGPAPEGYPTLVYFDGRDVQSTNAQPDAENVYKFTLNIGDPPTGWGG